MKNILMVLAIAAAMSFSAIAMAQTSAPAKRGAGLRGTIAKIEETKITVAARSGTETVVVTDDSTKVTLDGAPATFADLKVGQRVNVTPATGTATLIAARAPRAGGGNAPATPPATAPAPN